jgi:glycosyltransferase involved in cell wall biosynthesis
MTGVTGGDIAPVAEGAEAPVTMSAAAPLPKRMNCEPAARKLRMAFVYSRLPFPMMRGDQLTVAHLLSFLAARGHTIDFYTLDLDGKLEPSQDAWLRSICREVHIYQQGRFAKMRGLVKALFRRLPFQVGLFDNEALARDLHQAVWKGSYDIVYSYYLRSAPAVPVLPGAQPSKADASRSFLAMQLSQTLNARRIFENETNILKKAVFAIEARRLAWYEARIWQHFHRAVLIGPADVAAIRQQGELQNIPVIDNWVYGAHGTDTDRFVPARPDEIVGNRIVFSGSMLYRPNIQAALWFVECCWPAVRAAIPDAEFVIQGRDPAPEIQRLHGKDGIVVTGSVPDVGAMIRSAAVCVNPVLAAGGMQNKLIEYMACGKAVVATTVANEGIRAPAEALVIADTSAAFAQAVIDLQQDRAGTLALGERARAYASANWTWERHFLDLEQTYYDALDS